MRPGTNVLQAPRGLPAATDKLACAVEAELQVQLQEMMSELSQRVVKLCTELCAKRFSEALEEDRTAKVRIAASRGAELKADEAAREAAAILVSAAAVSVGTGKENATSHITSALKPPNVQEVQRKTLNALPEIQDLLRNTGSDATKGKFKGQGKDGKPIEVQRKGPTGGQDHGKGKSKTWSSQSSFDRVVGIASATHAAQEAFRNAESDAEPGAFGMQHADSKASAKGKDHWQTPKGAAANLTAEGKGEQTVADVSGKPFDAKAKGKGKRKSHLAQAEQSGGFFSSLFG